MFKLDQIHLMCPKIAGGVVNSIKADQTALCFQSLPPRTLSPLHYCPMECSMPFYYMLVWSKTI